jgi:hypothetical protein|nr:MAG TPA: internal virion protein A [Caudoviricetes sp.]
MVASSKVITEKFNKENKKHLQAVKYIEEHLRPIDKKELQGAYTSVTKCAMHEFCDNFLAFGKNSEPIAIYGIVKYPVNGCHAVWMVGTTKLKNYKKELITMGLDKISRFIKEYGPVTNYISIDNSESRRWLKRAGAVFGTPFNENGITWQQFVIRRNE